EPDRAAAFLAGGARGGDRFAFALERAGALAPAPDAPALAQRLAGERVDEREGVDDDVALVVGRQCAHVGWDGRTALRCGPVDVLSPGWALPVDGWLCGARWRCRRGRRALAS